MHTLLSSIFKAFNNLIQPSFCLLCFNRIPYNSKFQICVNCLGNIEYNIPPFCNICGRSLDDYPSHHDICKNCLLEEVKEFKSYYPFKYRGPVREGLHKLKYLGYLSLVKFFALNMIAFAKEHILPHQGIDYITYVPLHPKKLKEREFNQSYLLAKEISRATCIPLLKNLLVRIRYTRAQSQLCGEERKYNVKGAFKISQKYKRQILGSKLLLIDDIITTGSTVKECIKEIEKFNATVIVLTAAGG